MQKLPVALFTAGALFLCGCGQTPLGSSSIGNQAPFDQYVNRPVVLVSPVKVCYEERAHTWSGQTFKRGEMFYFCSGADQGEVAYEAPAGTPLVVKKVLYLSNASDNNIVALGEIYIRELGKNVPFDQNWSFFSEADHSYALVRTPWEPLDTPNKRVLKTGLIPNQYLGVKESTRK